MAVLVLHNILFKTKCLLNCSTAQMRSQNRIFWQRPDEAATSCLEEKWNLSRSLLRLMTTDRVACCLHLHSAKLQHARYACAVQDCKLAWTRVYPHADNKNQNLVCGLESSVDPVTALFLILLHRKWWIILARKFPPSTTVQLSSLWSIISW